MNIEISKTPCFELRIINFIPNNVIPKSLQAFHSPNSEKIQLNQNISAE